MNAGAMGSEVFDCVEEVRGVEPSGRVVLRRANEIARTYRRCPWLDSVVAISARFRGPLESREVIARRLKESNEKRWRSQPAAMSAGCVFKNPNDVPAGRLVEELGLKGERVGNAEVSTTHGNFIVNRGGASAADVLALIGQVQARALKERGVNLELEVRVVGEDRL